MTKHYGTMSCIDGAEGVCHKMIKVRYGVERKGVKKIGNASALLKSAI